MAACISGAASFISTAALQLKLNWYASTGNIDAPSNVVNDPVYVFTGKYDTIVYPAIAKLNAQLYSRLGANVKTNLDISAHHGFLSDHYGGSCATPNAPNYINNW